MLVDFESVLAMEHTGMVRMFKTLKDTGLKGFLEESSSVYKVAVLEFFTNAKVVAVTVISFIDNRKLALTKHLAFLLMGWLVISISRPRQWWTCVAGFLVLMCRHGTQQKEGNGNGVSLAA
ncbi:histone-lysine N-methyltransferase ATXR2 [Dorcoceras hygrometricum]|uniref:Histone-lysine N-methyltransferase ATXR2 n=1 Tax=Dorcoceras hygrometricum TaxID=472368 RepID=A0A2Z7BU11_9LAMI|nr:histone-lysine N-methyltransferase ATXR2 [Dorcoceras hygrometricum]